MLGRLARRLRLLGYDTFYSPGIDDNQLLLLARREERFILTRDTHFLKRGVKDCLFIRPDDVFGQLVQVFGAFGLKAGESRCAECNGALKAVEDKREIEGSVPDFVYENFRRFKACTGCGHVYWEGSQWGKLKRFADEIAESAPEGKG